MTIIFPVAGAYRHAPAAPASRGQGPAQGGRREADRERERASVRDVAQHTGEVPRHTARVHGAGVLLRRVHEGVLFRPGSGRL